MGEEAIIEKAKILHQVYCPNDRNCSYTEDDIKAVKALALLKAEKPEPHVVELPENIIVPGGKVTSKTEIIKRQQDEIDRLKARNKVKQGLLEVTENMLNKKIAENKQQIERIGELEETLSKDNTPEIDHKYINNIAKEVKANESKP